MVAAACQQVTEGGATREGLDTLAQVIIGAAVACKPAGNMGQDVVQVKAVGCSKHALGHAEIQHQQVATGAQNTMICTNTAAWVC